MKAPNLVKGLNFNQLQLEFAADLFLKETNRLSLLRQD
jgi:hypothetical protein